MNNYVPVIQTLIGRGHISGKQINSEMALEEIEKWNK